MKLEAWLLTQPREVSAVFAVRAALRVLPLVWTARDEVSKDDFIEGVVLPVFRATAGAWVAASYPGRLLTLLKATGAAAVASASTPRIAAPFILTAATSAATAANSATRANAAASTIRAADAAARAVYAVFGEGFSLGFNLKLSSLTAGGAEPVTAAYWSAVSVDATSVEEGAGASDIGRMPLWPQHLLGPDSLMSLWNEMEAALRSAPQDWRVWTTWYRDRLSGYVGEEERELAYVRIDNELWNQGPAIVNAEIKRRIKALPASPPLPAPIENVPLAISFGWSSKGTITVVSGALNWPAFPYSGGEKDHEHRLEACRVLATEIVQSLHRGRWNARPDYEETLEHYVARLPVKPREGNFLLADAEARIIRSMFASDLDMLSVGLAAKLKTFLEQHIGLRAYYPAAEEFYESVRTGHLEAPLPLDAFDGFFRVVRDHTPTRFEPNVAETLGEAAQPIPAIAPIDPTVPKSEPPPPAPIQSGRSI